MTGYVIAVGNYKGGVGKTTLSGNLAWALAAESGCNVVLVDADPQGSSTTWFDLCESDVPFERVQLNTAGLLLSSIRRLRHRHDLILIDCPPKDNEVTGAAFAQSDLGLVPLSPSPMDVFSYSRLVPMLNQARAINERLQLRFVVNQFKARTVLGRELPDALADADVPIAESMIRARQIYQDVVREGDSVVCHNGPARDEMLSLAVEVMDIRDKQSELLVSNLQGVA